MRTSPQLQGGCNCKGLPETGPLDFSKVLVLLQLLGQQVKVSGTLITIAVVEHILLFAHETLEETEITQGMVSLQPRSVMGGTVGWYAGVPWAAQCPRRC